LNDTRLNFLLEHISSLVFVHGLQQNNDGWVFEEFKKNDFLNSCITCTLTLSLQTEEWNTDY